MTGYLFHIIVKPYGLMGNAFYLLRDYGSLPRVVTYDLAKLCNRTTDHYIVIFQCYILQNNQTIISTYFTE